MADPRGRHPGRGAYICRSEDCWEGLQRRSRRGGPNLETHAEAFRLAIQGSVTENVSANQMKTEKVRRFLGLAVRARRVCVGSRDTRASLRRGQVSLVLLSEDGSSRDGERTARLAEEEGISVIRLPVGAEELGGWIGRNRVATFGIEDPDLAAAIRAHWNNEDESGPAGGPSERGGNR